MPDIALTFIFAYLLLGLFAGFLAGLLGIGGGVVMVPVLAMLFEAQGLAPDHVLHLALGTSMAAIVFSASASLRTHHARGAVRWSVVGRMTPGVLLGTAMGTLVARQVSTHGLALLFSGFVVFVAINMSLDLKPKPSRTLPGGVGLCGAGVLIGGVSALVAIGGGALTVPFLTWCNVSMQAAIGTSAALGLPIALGGSLGYLWNGMQESGLPAGSLGFIYLPALLSLLLMSTVAAPQGAKMAHRLSGRTLKRVFAAFLLLLCAKMLTDLLV